jgi:hypothetical protein
MVKFQKTVSNICVLYQTAAELRENNIHVHSTDEKMGIHAREHLHPKQCMKPGQLERIDPEYVRHGTSGLIASRNVVTGEIEAPMIQPTRTEDDFLAHIKAVIALFAEDWHIFISDNLNTHMSESLVKMVAKMEGIDESSLGVKDKSGILKSMETRAKFLEDRSHRVSFVYTPKHTSWVNQVECWFSIITRRLLNKRASFTSVEDLEEKIRNFIDYYNKYQKKPFRWNYKGNLLRI